MMVWTLDDAKYLAGLENVWYLFCFLVALTLGGKYFQHWCLHAGEY